MSFWRKNARACKHSGKAQLPLGRHAVKSSVAIVVRCSIGFMPSSNLASNQTRCMSCSPLEGLQPKSARIEKRFMFLKLTRYYAQKYHTLLLAAFCSILFFVTSYVYVQ